MELLKQLRDLQLIRPLDLQFARFIVQAESEQIQSDPSAQASGATLATESGAEALQLLSVLVSLQLGRGEVCLPVDGWQDLIQDWPDALRNEARQRLGNLSEEQLLQFTVVSDGSVASETVEAPLVLEQNRLYLYRYWFYETRVASRINGLVKPLLLDYQKVKTGLDQLFPSPVTEPSSSEAKTDWQKVAVAIAVRCRFSVISGGPGTGKTTTVARLLALYTGLFLAEHGRAPEIKLAAPTGKAAARLSESLGQARQGLSISDELKQLIPDQAQTLHRLLGPRPDSKAFRHNADNPLHLDLLVVDEASMIDLPMIWRLLDALPAHAQLIMIGDKDQLASVEAGSVLGDICAWQQFSPEGELTYSHEQNQYLQSVCGLASDAPESGQHAIARSDSRTVANALALLRHSYRFDEHSGIGQLAKAVNSGEGKVALQLFSAGLEDIALLPLTETGYQTMVSQVAQGYKAYLQEIAQGARPESVLTAFNRIQLLAVLREGVYGVTGLNLAIEQHLNRAGLINSSANWYPGRPVMITRNDYQLGLYNGDIGIAIEDQDGRLRVWFELPDGEMKGVLPGRLPEHETVYAMTVHKSQGSEFDQVVMLLPAQETPLLSRELIYTGITRARKTFTLLTTSQALISGCARQTERASGLGWRLWR